MNESTQGAQAPLESSEPSGPMVAGIPEAGTAVTAPEHEAGGGHSQAPDRARESAVRSTGAPERRESAETADEVTDASDATDATDATDVSGTSDDESGTQDAAGGRSKRKQALYNEGEIAADFLETLLDIADLDGDLDVDVDGDRAAIAIVDSDEGRVSRRLVGERGVVLEALQELARLAVQAETGERSRLMLDIAGHRAARRTELVRLAKDAIEEARSTGSKVSLEPMSAFERKVVHDEVTAAGLESESEGVEPRRYIVIHPVG